METTNSQVSITHFNLSLEGFDNLYPSPCHERLEENKLLNLEYYMAEKSKDTTSSIRVLCLFFL